MTVKQQDEVTGLNKSVYNNDKLQLVSNKTRRNVELSTTQPISQLLESIFESHFARSGDLSARFVSFRFTYYSLNIPAFNFLPPSNMKCCVAKRFFVWILHTSVFPVETMRKPLETMRKPLETLTIKWVESIKVACLHSINHCDMLVSRPFVTIPNDKHFIHYFHKWISPKWTQNGCSSNSALDAHSCTNNA